MITTFDREVVMHVLRNEMERLVCAQIGSGQIPFAELEQRIAACCKHFEERLLSEQAARMGQPIEQLNSDDDIPF